MLSDKLTEKERELLVITMEECGELSSACSKLLRFGNEIKHLDNILQEAGDVLCMVSLLLEYGFIEEEQLQEATQNKLNKLKEWSSLVDNNSRSVH
jgi:NTP pyrophosphatase (non-canonical NTP hydrolase)